MCGLLADYEKSEEGFAGYVLFHSLMQFHGFMKDFHNKVLEETVEKALEISKIDDDFGKGDEPEVNTAILLAGAMTIAGGFGVTSPWVVGPATIGAGAAVIGGNANPQGQPDGKGPLEEKLKDQFKRLRTLIEEANNSVFGIPGSNPKKQIPSEMQKQTYDNPSVRALGDGQWFSPDPSAGLQDMVDEIFQRIVSWITAAIPVPLRPWHRPRILTRGR